MNTSLLESLSIHPVVTGLGWTLIHFLWQATVIALVFACVLALSKRFTAHVRYAISCGGLLLMVGAPMMTFALMISSVEDGQWQVARERNESRFGETEIADKTVNQGPTPASNEFEFLASNPGQTSPTGVADPGSASTYALFRRSVDQIRRGLPLLVVAWMICVMLLAIRLVFGLARVSRWRGDATEIKLEKLVQVFQQLTQQMNIRQRVQLLESTFTQVPAVIGWIRPVVLVPTSLVSGLTTLELETILAHELAHVRRHDYLVNILQTVVETVLFYHPAVWWLSNRIRIEREHCCDDEAVRVCGDRVTFIKALARMEELRCAQERFAIAANGGSLVGRLRRLANGDPRGVDSWWPAGAMALGVMTIVFAGLWASDIWANSPEAVIIPPEVSVRNDDDKKASSEKPEKFATRKVEVQKTDSKTGIEKRVFADIKLSTMLDDTPTNASVDMMYSNVMMYTFIPARIAKQLGAIELGEIDFGEKAPPKAKRLAFQSGFRRFDIPEKKVTEPNTLKVNELVKPAGDAKVVPYGNDAIWIPGHLGFYGMNKGKQHSFNIVRIEKVDLGVGPAFGPVNALVLDDNNSDFGVLGRDWVQHVRGKKGESLWHYAADGSFHLMLPSKTSATKRPANQDNVDEPRSNSSTAVKQSIVKSESTGHPVVDPRMARPDIKVLKSHTYDLSRRESTGWVKLKNANVPIDVGVEYENVIVYMTLFHDIVAVDKQTGNSIWSIDWGKQTPFWQTVSIVEVDQDGKKTTAVELFAPQKKTQEVVYRYYLLKDGSPIQVPTKNTKVQTVPKESEPRQTKTRPSSDGELPKISVAAKDGDRVTRAFANATKSGRSPAELLKHFSRSTGLDRPPITGRITNMETIVSAFPDYLLDIGMDADEVTFNLPEGSGMRAVFSGKQVAIVPSDNTTEVVVTEGKVELLDGGGVVRATASADGGAEQLIVNCRMAGGEIVMVMKTKRIKPDTTYPDPPVQVRMNLQTGAPEGESDPPHGAIRYAILPEDKDDKKPARMKMHWYYDLRRMTDEAEEETGKTWQELLYGDQSNQEKPKTESSKTDSKPKSDTNAVAERQPWIAKGRVTDASGKPIKGAAIRAHCGFGSLRQSGSATSDADGKYEMRFGPGMWSSEPTFVQAATISVHLDGYFEQNLHRQGDLVAALEKPKGEIGWGKTENELFLPGKPKEIDFVMVPSTSLRGIIFQNGKPASGFRVSMTGDELPPSSSVIANAKTNDKGEFEFKDLPTGFKFQFLVEPPKAQSPWLAWASPPVVFTNGDTNDTHFEFSIDGKPVDFSCQYFQILINGDGVNWKQALKESANKKLSLTWNGLSTDNTVRAADASIELGK